MDFEHGNIPRVQAAKLSVLGVLVLLTGFFAWMAAENLYLGLDGQPDDYPPLPWAIVHGLIAAAFALGATRIFRWYRRSGR